MNAAIATAQEFAISRELDAPRAAVWKAWTEADRLEKWWGPKGSKIRVLKLDLRPGGMFHYSMEYQAGKPMYGRFVYREVVAPERLVYVSSFSDPAAGVIRAPFLETFPLEILNEITFSERDGKTTLSLRGGPIDASDVELKVFTGMFDSMRQGFGGTFDQLADYLSRR